MEHICNKSDFTLTFALRDKVGNIIPYGELDWEVWYYTVEKYPYKITHKEGILSSNAEIVDNKIVAYVNGFDFVVKGDVYRKVFASFPNQKFADGKANVSSVEEIVITFKIV